MDYREEQEIDLLDLLFYVLEKWRIILIVAVAGMLLFGAYKFIGYEKSRAKNDELIAMGKEDEVIYPDSYQSALDALNEKNKEIQKLQEQITELRVGNTEYRNDISNNRDLITTTEESISLFETEQKEVQRKLSELQSYMSNTVLLQIDATSRPIAKRIYQVNYNGEPTKTLFRDPVDEILAAYTANLTLIEAGSGLAEKYNVSEKYLDELFSVWYDGTPNYIYIDAYGKDQAMAKDIQNAVCTLLENRFGDLSAQYHDHALLVVSDEYVEVVDEDLAQNQAGRYSMLNDYNSQIADYDAKILSAKTNIDNLNASITTLQQQIETNSSSIDDLQNDILKINKSIISGNLEEAVESKKPSIMRSLKDAIKNGIIAAIVIGLIGCIYYALVYILDGKLHTALDLPVGKDFPLLAVFSRPMPENMNFFDKWIYQHRNKNYETPNEEVLRTASVSIAALLDGKTNVAVLSTLKENGADTLAQKLSLLIPETKFVAVEDSIRAFESAEKLSNVDTVVLFETREQSKHSQIIAELSQTSLLEKPVLGVIVS